MVALFFCKHNIVSIFDFPKSINHFRMKNVGIDAINYYVPNLFVDMQDLSLAREIPFEKLSHGLGLKKMSIPDKNEDRRIHTRFLGASQGAQIDRFACD